MKTPQEIAFSVYNTLINVVDDVYDEVVPKAFDFKKKEFIVFRVESTRPRYDFDNGSTTSATVYVECYVKNKANGVKNTAGIKVLTEGVMQAMQNLSMRVSLSNLRPSSNVINDYNAQVLIFNVLTK